MSYRDQTKRRDGILREHSVVMIGQAWSRCNASLQRMRKKKKIEGANESTLKLNNEIALHKVEDPREFVLDT